MEMNLNKELNNVLKKIDIYNKPNLFLHSCCGPCSTAVLDKLCNFFNIYIIFYNSNVDTIEEYRLRFEQLLKFINNFGKGNIKIIYNYYNHLEYLEYIKGLEDEVEGGKRCYKCFELRLLKSYEIANNYIISNKLNNDINYLTSTLSISPHKNSSLIYEIGSKICENSTTIKYLPSDFKKENGYLNSIILSKKYNLYRQSYCGCEYAKKQ